MPRNVRENEMKLIYQAAGEPFDTGFGDPGGYQAYIGAVSLLVLEGGGQPQIVELKEPESGRRRQKMKKHVETRGRRPFGAQVAFARVATGLGWTSLGALAIGASAAGAVAIGALAIRKLAIKRGRIEKLSIEDLEVGRLRVRELIIEQEQRKEE